MSSDLLHGAEVKQGYLVGGDNTVMAFCRYENNSARNNFILLDVDERKIFCDPSVASWLPEATMGHLTKLSKTIAEKKPAATVVAAGQTAAPTSSPGNSSKKKSRYSHLKHR